jgi:peptidoglycan/xylan/chitin deacetylase (PgdA/CDA1 family)
MLALPLHASAQAPTQNCPRPGTLGTARVLAIDPAATPRIGRKSFPQTLPLTEKEVVLTFDDGPWPSTTAKVHHALAAECVQATFFLIGRNAHAHPELVRRIAAEGHTVGHHTWSHKILSRTSARGAREEIDRGMDAVAQALGEPVAPPPRTPFFRFPGFAATKPLLDDLAERRIAVFGADLWASDWLPMTPDQQLRLITDRLKHARRGIVLFHDTKIQTAVMLPAFLRYLRMNGYRVVHIVPQAAER